jgi:hypothetical protein
MLNYRISEELAQSKWLQVLCVQLLPMLVILNRGFLRNAAQASSYLESTNEKSRGLTGRS